MNIATMKTFNALLLLSAVSISGPVFASEDATDGAIEDPIAHGEEAHKNHCYKCHTDNVYTRENRFVKSIDALSKQVVRCKEGSDIPWFEEDADAVVQFLNKKYYRF